MAHPVLEPNSAQFSENMLRLYNIMNDRSDEEAATSQFWMTFLATHDFGGYVFSPQSKPIDDGRGRIDLHIKDIQLLSLVIVATLECKAAESNWSLIRDTEMQGLAAALEYTKGTAINLAYVGSMIGGKVRLFRCFNTAENRQYKIMEAMWGQPWLNSPGEISEYIDVGGPDGHRLRGWFDYIKAHQPRLMAS